MRQYLGRVCAFITLIVAAAAAGAQQDAQPIVEAAQIEVFQGPRVKEATKLSYPVNLERRYKEGWVHVNVMVDPEGKPYEAMVSQSSGDKRFQEYALSAMEGWRFDPATLDGQPIDSAYEIKITFDHARVGAGARSQFVRAYRALMKSIDANDRAAADSALAKLEVDNLYEDAFLGFAQYAYAKKWGTESEQLEGLTRAVAREAHARFLPPDTFRFALLGLLPLQIQSRDFVGALASWDALQKLKVDKKTLSTIEPVINQVHELKSSGRSFSVDGELEDGSWYFRPFLRKFSAQVSEGKITEVKLRCDKKYVFFSFDPKLEYTISEKYGSCSLQFIGDPGTRFKLTQSG